jgi:lysophospholipase L1-like esterase
VRAPLIALLVAAAVVPMAAAQDAPLQMSASQARTGRVDLTLTGPAGAQVEVTDESVPRRVGTVTLDANGAGTIRRAATWTCRHRSHTFSATGSAPDGTALEATTTATTPNCGHRYALVVRPRHPRAGQPVRVSVRDRFRLGDTHARVCARGPGNAKTCHRAPARLRLAQPGRWHIRVKHTAATVRVRPRKHLRVLATGDSMIQIIDGFLKDRLAERRASVRSDAHISSGLSKPDFFNWPAHAREQVASYHPDITIMFIGANDGFPFGSTPCCGTAWRHKYAKVAAGMMRTYQRSGTVYWCLLPAPRASNFRRVFVAVNAAVRRAAKRTHARLIDLPHTFTPGYRFRQSIVWHGRSVSVRQDDGVHLNVAGASIAATLMIRRMVRGGAV